MFQIFLFHFLAWLILSPRDNAKGQFLFGSLHSSPTEEHIDFTQFFQWPWVTDPDLGSSWFCQDQFDKIKMTEVGVGDLGTSEN